MLDPVKLTAVLELEQGPVDQAQVVVDIVTLPQGSSLHQTGIVIRD